MNIGVVVQHDMGVLRQKVDEAVQGYRGRSEANMRPWELTALRGRIDGILRESPFREKMRLLVGFNQQGNIEVMVWPSDGVASA
jgi:hypothetical protein